MSNGEGAWNHLRVYRNRRHFTAHPTPFSFQVCADNNHVRTWTVTRFRGMISTQPGSTPLASFKILALDELDGSGAGADIGEESAPCWFGAEVNGGGGSWWWVGAGIWHRQGLSANGTSNKSSSNAWCRTPAKSTSAFPPPGKGERCRLCRRRRRGRKIGMSFFGGRG